MKIEDEKLEAAIDSALRQFLQSGELERRVQQIQLERHLVFGDASRLKISDSAVVNDALFNLVSGGIEIHDHVFFGHGVSILTGTHDFRKFGLDRIKAVPTFGRDVVIEEGAWLASKVTVLGPCIIGANAVVASGSLVTDDVPPYTLVAGVPAQLIKEIDH